jgi:signal transduction histidine kinase
MIINTLIFIFGAILFISAVMTLVVWVRFKNALLKTLFLFWGSGILGYFAQGIFNKSDIFGLFAFGTNSLTIYFLLKLFNQAAGKDQKSKLIGYRWFLSVTLLSALAVSSLGSYFAGILIYCTGSFAALIYGAFGIAPKKLDFFARGYQILIVFAGIHFLDYPFFRADEKLMVLGFSLSILFYFCFAIFVPVLILQKISQSYVQKLESEVDLRTRQLSESNAHLQATFSDLKENKEKINILLSDNQIRMSALVHDVATPLQVIAHNIAFLSKSRDKIHEIFDQKSGRIQSAVETLKQILAEARRTHTEITGKSDLVLTRINIQSIVLEVVRGFEEKLHEKRLLIDTSGLEHSGSLYISGHENWLKNQVLSNLISNAIKFSNPGSTIQIGAKLLDSGRVAILVEDNGVGIPVEKRDAIFSFDKKTTTRGTMGEKGTGLGLPIVKQYTELMGGKIVLLNKEQSGTSFQIELQKAA